MGGQALLGQLAPAFHSGARGEDAALSSEVVRVGVSEFVKAWNWGREKTRLEDFEVVLGKDNG